MDDNDNTIEYQCSTCTVQWTPGDEIFIIYNNDYNLHADIYHKLGKNLSRIAKQVNCQYDELIATIASMVITYVYNKSNIIFMCRGLTISKDEATYGYKNKIYFTHDIAENIKIIQDILNLYHTRDNDGLKRSIIDLTYAICVETNYHWHGRIFSDKKAVVCVQNKHYMVNSISVIETSTDIRWLLGRNIVVARTKLDDMNGKIAKALITRERLLGSIQDSDSNIVKKLRLIGQQVMTCEEVRNIWGW